MTIVALCAAFLALGLILGCVLSGIERRAYPPPTQRFDPDTIWIETREDGVEVMHVNGQVHIL